jgi:hypothetical protein
MEVKKFESCFLHLGVDGFLRIALGIGLNNLPTLADEVTGRLSLLSGRWEHVVEVVLSPLLLNDKKSPYPNLIWAQAEITPPRIRFCDYHISLQVGEKTFYGIKRAGWRDRDCLLHCFKKHLHFLINSKRDDSNALRLLNKSQPRLALHLWHQEIGIQLLNATPFPPAWSELVLLVPDNLPSKEVLYNTKRVADNLGFRRTVLLPVPAKGRDIGGLVSLLLHLLNCDEEDQRPCLFLHTKNSAHLPDLISRTWREMLLSRILMRKSCLASALRYLQFEKYAIVASRDVRRLEKCDNGRDSLPHRSAELASQIYWQLFRQKTESFEFCAGTMMWFVPRRIAKAWTISRLVAILENLEDSAELCEPSWAHAFERLFPSAVANAGGNVLFI